MKIFVNSWRDTAHPLAGGSEVVVDRIAKEFLALGHDVTVAVPRPVEAHPYRVVTSGSFYSQYLRSPLTAWRNARSVDVVIDVANGIPHFTPLWRRRSRVICWVQHVCDGQWFESFPRPIAAIGRFLELKVMPRVYRRATFVAISSSTADALVQNGVSPGAITVINIGVDVSAARPEQEKSETPLFVTVARLVPNKRVDVLIDMWRAIGPELGGQLVIIGDGPLRDQLNCDLPPKCELLGRVSDEERDNWLQRAWVYLQTSTREGWGISVIEAAIQGTPALSFDVPGLRDVIVDGETGVLAQDSDEFMLAWIALAADSKRRAQLGEAARRRAVAFTWETSARRLEELILMEHPNGA